VARHRVADCGLQIWRVDNEYSCGQPIRGGPPNLWVGRAAKYFSQKKKRACYEMLYTAPELDDQLSDY
jgi:hypothetical protein